MIFELLVPTALFLAGFFLLIKGSDWIIDGASSIAKKLNLSTWLIGLTVVGIGTSIPELVVALFGNLGGAENIALGTIIGSNTFNLLFILGICALITPLAMKRSWVHLDLPVNVLSVAAAGAVVWLNLLDPAPYFISRTEGAVLIAMFGAWLYWLYYSGRTHGDFSYDGTSLEEFPLKKSLGLVLVGIVGVFLGGEWVVEGAVFFAGLFGVSQAFIGLFLVGIGTSLPELVVSVRAAYRKDPGIAVGNIIGSNIFDFLFILGSVALVAAIPFDIAMSVDLAVTAIAALLVFGVAVLSSQRAERGHLINRASGAFLIAAYLLYAVFLFYRG